MSPKSVLRSFLLSISFLAFYGAKGRAQSNLNRVISIDHIEKQQLASVLKKISATGNFNFAYNNKTIPADSVISVNLYHGTIMNFLDKVLGMTYEYKEISGYIVLRHAPHRLDLTAEMLTDVNKQWIVKGHVTDAAGNNALNHVSIYEKNLLLSTLTDVQGNFELNLKNWNGAVMLTASKEEYRDTTLNLLQDVEVTSKHSAKSYKYFPINDQSVTRFTHGIARMFIGSKQLIQGLNLGNYFATSPYQISLTPGLSSHGMYNSQVIDHFSLNLLGGYTAGIDGAEVAGIFNINRGNVSFFQGSGVFNLVGGNTYGLQFAGLYNQVFNKAEGIQFAGAVNKTQTFSKGLQVAGLANFTGEGKGIEVAGLLNNADVFTGFQLSGIMNRAGRSQGLQLAMVNNIAKETVGTQISSIANFASKVKGIQVAGILNVADSSDYPIAIINFVKNGKKTLGLSTDEFLFTHVDFRSGGRVLYGVVGCSFQFSGEPAKYGLETGLGAHLVNGRHFIMDTEYTYLWGFGSNSKSLQINALKILPGLKLSRRLLLFAGPSINQTSFDKKYNLHIPGWEINRRTYDDGTYEIHLGITGGLQVTL
jgi:hypothetical protein